MDVIKFNDWDPRCFVVLVHYLILSRRTKNVSFRNLIYHVTLCDTQLKSVVINPLKKNCDWYRTQRLPRRKLFTSVT